MGKISYLKPGKRPKHRFEALMQPHFEPLYRAARRMTLSPEDAEDLLQEVCIVAFDHLEELEQIEFPRAWLLKVMYNRFIDGTRQAERSPVDAALTGQQSEEPDESAAIAERLDELVDRQQHVERILHAMRYLNTEQCALVAMHDVEGMSIEELARITGRPPGTIKSQLHRTRQKLGRLLANEAFRKPYLRVVGGKDEM